MPGGIVDERLGMLERDQAGERQDRDAGEQRAPCVQRRRDPPGALEQRSRVEQRHLERQRIDRGQQPAAPALGLAARQAREVGALVERDQSRIGKLLHEVDDLVLRGHGIAVLREEATPQCLDRLPTVEAAGEAVGRQVQPHLPAEGLVAVDVPDLAAHALPADAHRGLEAQHQLRHPEPVGRVERVVAHHPSAQIRSASARHGRSKSTCPSRRLPASNLATPA